MLNVEFETFFKPEKKTKRWKKRLSQKWHCQILEQAFDAAKATRDPCFLDSCKTDVCLFLHPNHAALFFLLNERTQRHKPNPECTFFRSAFVAGTSKPKRRLSYLQSQPLPARHDLLPLTAVWNLEKPEHGLASFILLDHRAAAL